MKRINSCDFCGNKEFKFLFLGKDKSFNMPGKFKVVKCQNCGFIFLNPRPQKELENYYPAKYYSYNLIDTGSLKLRIKLLLYDLYFNPKNKNSLLKVLFLPLIFYSRGTIISPGKKLLDIGSGSGQFLYEMKQLGMDGEGIEPGNFNKESAKKAGLSIKQKNLFDAKYPADTFDVITINHVLEHTPNPSGIIKETYRILRKEGNLIIAVPNYISLAYSLFGKNWYQLDIPRHLHDFSDKILAKKLENEGFKIKKIRYNSRPSQFTVSLMYSLNLDAKKNRVLSMFFNILFLPLTYLVNILKVGDQIEIYCKK